MRGQLTTKNISAALKLARDALPVGNYPNVAFDRKTGNWLAWQVDEKYQQIGLMGCGRDPVTAVEAMIENNRNNEE